jgi:penicillin-binding protein 1A
VHDWLASRAGKLVLGAIVLGTGTLACAALLLTFVFAIAYSNLPPIDSLVDYRPKIPLRVWSADGVLIGEFGEERRDYVKIDDVPAQLKQAILAAEDDRFYQHSGVDLAGLTRAVIANFVSGRRGQGGSTITMQIARTFYLPSEKLYTRKIYEIALAFKIEAELSKDRILEVYINQIFLGQRAYGFGAAAQTYFGKRLGDLSVGEMAVLAGLSHRARSTRASIRNAPRPASSTCSDACCSLATSTSRPTMRQSRSPSMRAAARWPPAAAPPTLRGRGCMPSSWPRSRAS